MNRNLIGVGFNYAHHAEGGYNRILQYLGADEVINYRSFDVMVKGWSSGVSVLVRGFRYRRWAYLTTKDLASRLTTGSPRIVFITYPENLLARRVVATKRAQDVYVAAFHQPPSWYKSRNAKALRQCASAVDLGIALGTSQVATLKDVLGIKKVCVIPHGVTSNPGFIDIPLERQSLPPLCLSIGGWLRDIDHYCRVVSTARSHGENFRYVYVSPPAAYEPRLKRMGITVLRDVPQEALTRLYCSASVLFLPLTDAVANNAVLEGLMAGVPIVCPNVGDIRDYLDALSLSYLYNSDQEAVFSLSRAVEVGRRMTSVDRAHRSQSAAARFSWDVIGGQVRREMMDFD